MLKTAKRKYTHSDLEKVYNECQPCKSAEKKGNKPVASGRMYQRPLEQLNVDLAEMSIKGKGHTVFVATDAMTGFTYAKTMSGKTTAQTAGAVAMYISTSGTSERVHTANGGELMGMFNTLCEQEGIVHKTTAAYSPWMNGIAEQKNNTIQMAIKKLEADTALRTGNSADDFLSAATHAVNSYDGPYGYTPFFLFHGREPRAPTHLAHMTGEQIEAASEKVPEKTEKAKAG